MLILYSKFALFRLMSVFIVQTYFVADEYWQSLEIAHLHTFGYGWKTWEYKEGIRSYAYPMLYYSYFKLLSIFSFDNVISITVGSRVLQALITSFSDLLFYRWCRSFQLLPAWIILVLATDWFTFYCASRTLINTFELNLVIIGLYIFPWSDLCVHGKLWSGNIKGFITIVCISSFIRPTAIAIWGPFSCYWFISANLLRRKTIMCYFLCIGTIVALFLVALDSYFYGFLVITPWNFLKFNLINNISIFYGTHPFHWYYLQGIPVVLGVATFPFLFGLWSFSQSVFNGNHKSQIIRCVNYLLLFTVFTAILIYSFIPHKEFRFILALSPMMQFIALQSLNSIKNRKIQKVYAAVSVSTFVVLTCYFGIAHQRGTLSVFKQLSIDAQQRPNHTSILVLTPCHNTPLYSHLHVNVPVKFIECEPPLQLDDRDESEEFFFDPLTWLQLYWEKNPLPTHILMYDTLASRLNDYVADKNFLQLIVYFHTALPESRTGNFIILYRHRDWVLNESENSFKDHLEMHNAL